jgi:spore germination cell wall hydrolase CwlJ-like protein
MMTAAPRTRTRRSAATAILLLFACASSGLLALRRVQEPAASPTAERLTVAADRLVDPVAIPADGDWAAPAAGVTGTIALPPLPKVAQEAGFHSALTAAPPFAGERASPTDRARALECLTAAIHYEAASEPDAGQRAVAQVVLNRVRHPAFPATVCGVVYQGSERRGCQFSFACDGSLARVPSRSAWARAAANAAAALAGGVYAPVGLATHYHTYAVRPVWNRSLVMTDVVGAHFFHRWKGWWGTAAAFRQGYHGGEPVPGPHAPVVQPLQTASAVPVMAMPVEPPSERSEAPDAVTGSGVPLAAATAEDRLPPASEILDRWKDSGKPLR